MLASVMGMAGATAAVNAARRSRSSRQALTGRTAPAATPGTGQRRAGLLPRRSAGAPGRRWIPMPGVSLEPQPTDPPSGYKTIPSISAHGTQTAEARRNGQLSGSVPSVMPAMSARKAILPLATARTQGTVLRTKPRRNRISQGSV